MWIVDCSSQLTEVHSASYKDAIVLKLQIRYLLSTDVSKDVLVCHKCGNSPFSLCVLSIHNIISESVFVLGPVVLVGPIGVVDLGIWWTPGSRFHT